MVVWQNAQVVVQNLTIKQEQQQNPLRMCGLLQSEHVFDKSSLCLLPEKI